MTAAERLLALAGATGTAAALLLAIGSGATAGAALVDYSGLPTGTAATHLLTDAEVATTSPAGGSSTKAKRKPLIIVEIDGVEFRVPFDELPQFIAAQKKVTKAAARKHAQKARKRGITPKPAEAPQIVLKSAPIEYLPQIQAAIDNSNDIAYILWRNAILAYMQEVEDEEFLLLIV